MPDAESILLAAHEEARLYRPSAKGEALCRLAVQIHDARGDTRRAEQWTLEAQRESFDFASFKREALRQQAMVAARWLC
ncbi:MAG: hypothetical protein JNJ55_09645 [Betaproteobacteria bacterium]|nr:hypothetical protein [Betaproteobacteria bacterium]